MTAPFTRSSVNLSEPKDLRTKILRKSNLTSSTGLLERSTTSKQDAALIADLLSLPNDGRYPSLELPPPERRQRMLGALVSQVVTLSQQNPVLDDL